MRYLGSFWSRYKTIQTVCYNHPVKIFQTHAVLNYIIWNAGHCYAKIKHISTRKEIKNIPCQNLFHPAGSVKKHLKMTKLLKLQEVMFWTNTYMKVWKNVANLLIKPTIIIKTFQHRKVKEYCFYVPPNYMSSPR